MKSLLGECKLDRKWKTIVCAGFSILYGCMTLLLSYKLAYMEGSDIAVHMKSALQINISYPGWHIIVKGLVMLGISRYLAAAVVTAVFNGLTAVIVCFALVLKKSNRLIFLLPFAVLFFGPLYIPSYNGGGYNEYYLGQIFANQWHNPTNIAVRAVGLCCILLTLHLFSKEKGMSLYKLLLNSILLVISIFFKPSFMQIYLPAVTLFLIFLIIKKQLEKKEVVKFLLTLLPSVAVLVYQYLFFFGKDSGGIQFSFFEVMNHYSKNVLFSIVISMIFPILFLIIYWKDALKDNLYVFSLLLFAIGFAEFVFVVENNYRRFSGNFGWGAQLGLFFFVFATIKNYSNSKYNDSIACEKSRSMSKKTKSSSISTIKVLILNILLIGHTFSGLGYYIYLLCFSNKQL